jgi:hypothetical protein
VEKNGVIFTLDKLPNFTKKTAPISTWLTEAACFHTPLLQWLNILHPPGKAFNQLQ